MTSSSTVKLKEFGESGATRASGQAAREAVRHALKDLDALVLDFEGFRITPSFADELVGKLAAELGPDEFRRRISAEHASEATRTLLRHAVRRRLGERLSA